jgi:hypothetical protein
MNNSSNNKWFIFKIPFRNVCTIIPSLACFLTRYIKLIVLEFYHVLALGWVFNLSLTNLPNLSIIFPNFFFSALDAIQTTTSLNYRPPPMCVPTSHWPYGYPPLTLRPWQRMHRDSWCSLWHLCCHYARS